MATANLFDLDAELGSEEDEDYDEETGAVKTKTRPTNGANNMDDSSEEEEDDDEEAERAVSMVQS